MSGTVAAALVGLEGLGIAALVVWQIGALAAGDTDSLANSIALAVLTFVGAAAVLAFAAATWRGQSWGRSGAIVTQILVLAVALGAVTGAYADPAIALVLAAPAVVTLIALVIATHDAGRAARGNGDDGRGAASAPRR